MKKSRVLSTTPIASVPARLIVALAAVVTAYYRLSLPFFLVILYLAYLMWSYYWALMCCRFTVGKSVTEQENIFAGETFTREFIFVNGWFLPLVRCGISFLLPSQFTCSSNVPVVLSKVSGNEGVTVLRGQVFPSWNHCTVSYAWLPEKKEVAVRLQVEAQLRGIYYLPPPHFFVEDPAGLFRGVNQIGKEQLSYVFPRLKSPEDLMKAMLLEENHRENSFGLEDRYQAQGVRDYQVVDPPKSINWYASARTGSLKTNLYPHKDSEFCLVVFDLSVSPQPTYIPHPTRVTDPLLEDAISMAAGIAITHLEQGAMTAFYTNAPLLKWEKTGDPLLDASGAYMKKVRQVTTLDFDRGTRQAQNILELCATIDETGRAYPPEDQEELWSRMRKIPPNTLVYLIGYYRPPAFWEQEAEFNTDRAVVEPAGFFTRERLSALRTSRVRRIIASGEEGAR